MYIFVTLKWYPGVQMVLFQRSKLKTNIMISSGLCQKFSPTTSVDVTSLDSALDIAVKLLFGYDRLIDMQMSRRACNITCIHAHLRWVEKSKEAKTKAKQPLALTTTITQKPRPSFTAITTHHSHHINE